MILRISASRSPRQSPSSAIRLSIRFDALICPDGAATALRGVTALRTTCAAGFFTTFATFLDNFPSMVFTPGVRRPAEAAGADDLRQRGDTLAELRAIRCVTSGSSPSA